MYYTYTYGHMNYHVEGSIGKCTYDNASLRSATMSQLNVDWPL